MGWTNDQFDGTLTIPTGATSGQRIVIDGTTGTITGYDSTDTVTFTITPTGGFSTFLPADPPDPARSAQLTAAELKLAVDAGLDDMISTSLAVNMGSFPFSEQHVVTTLQSGFISGYDAPFVTMGSSSPDFNRDYDITTDNMSIDLASELRLVGSGMKIDEVSQGRGIVEYQAIQASTATTTTTETVGIDSDSFTLRDGRAYRVTAKGIVSSTIAGDIVRILVRKGALGGNGYVDSFDALRVHTAGGLTSFYYQNDIVNTSGADITDDAVMTYQRVNGTGNVRIIASSFNPAYIEVEDIGAATDYPDAFAVT